MLLRQTKKGNSKDVKHIVNSKFFKTEAVVRRCSVKKIFLEISQNSQQNARARVSFLRTPFLTEHLR